MVFLCGGAGCKDDVMPEEQRRIRQREVLADFHRTIIKPKISKVQQKVSLQDFLIILSLKCFSIKQDLLVLLEKVRGFKQFRPFCFSLKNLICDAEACACNTHHETIM